jgi:hypothetical protein
MNHCKVIGRSSQNLNGLAGAFFHRVHQRRSVVLVAVNSGDSMWVCAYAATGLKSAGKISTLLVFRCPRIV